MFLFSPLLKLGGTEGCTRKAVSYPLLSCYWDIDMKEKDRTDCDGLHQGKESPVRDWAWLYLA